MQFCCPQNDDDDDDHRHGHGHNHLHCFAHPTVPWDVARNYVYEWYKLENNDTAIKIGPKQDQPLIEYQEEMIKPPGLVLTLGKIEVSHDDDVRCNLGQKLDESREVSVQCL